MQIRDKGLAALAAASFGLWMCFSPPAQAESSSAAARKSADAPIVLSTFNKKKLLASAKSKSHVARAKHGAKLADAAARGKLSKSDDALKKLAAQPSVANARAELTVGNLHSRDDDDARNLAAADDNDIITMNGVQIASANQLNDIDRAMATEKAEVKTEDLIAVAPVPAPASGRIVRAVPSSERQSISIDQSHPWSSTSLIGKIFVAFGSLLTLASAARLIIA